MRCAQICQYALLKKVWLFRFPKSLGILDCTFGVRACWDTPGELGAIRSRLWGVQEGP